MSVVVSVLHAVRALVRSRAALHLEILALRHQIQILERSRQPRVRLTAADRLLWIWFSRIWPEWRAALVLVTPDTVLVWHRRGFRLFWTWKSRRRSGRPSVAADVRALIRTMSDAKSSVGCAQDPR
jgi:putative transposase